MATPAMTSFIQNLYTNLLQRTGDDAGINYWSANADAGMTAADMTKFFIDSPEGRNVNSILHLYDVFFNRTPDSAGLNYWVSLLNNGATPDQIANTFGASSEFNGLYAGTSTADYVEAMYGNIFVRPSDVSGKDYWVNQIDSGAMTRTELGLAFSQSDEALSSAGAATRFSESYLVLRASGDSEPTTAVVQALATKMHPDQLADLVSSYDPVISDAAATAAATAAVADATAEEIAAAATTAAPAASDRTAPTMLSAAIAANGSTIVITYSEALAGTAEAADFAITLGSGTTTVTNATIGTGLNANAVTLTLASPIDAGNTASIGYTATAGTANSIQDVAATPNSAPTQTLASGNVTNNSSNLVFNLTTGVDNFTGVASNDRFLSTYDGGVSTDTFGFGGNDVLNGAGGTDTLFISHLIDSAITPPDSLWSNITNIENIIINTTGNGAQTISTGSNFETAFATAGVNLSTTTSGSGAINITMTGFTGAATLATTSLDGAQTVVTGSGATTVTATSGAGALDIKGIGLATVVATTSGAGAQTIGDGAGNGANLVNVTANSGAGAQTITSTSTANVTVTATSTSGVQTITTGSGNDTITATAATGTNNTITTGAGNDIVVAGLGTDLITGGLGTDTLTGGGGTDRFEFGIDGSIIGTNLDVIRDFNTAGTDILTFNGATTTVLATDSTPLVAGSGSGANVQTTAGGLITFAAGDNTLLLKIAALQADTELKAAGSVAMFINGTDTFVYYAGTTTAATDDQLIQLTGITTLATITGGATTTIASGV